VYLVKNGDQLDKIIIPVRGYGLWSTLFGFLALESDATTVSGITFYDHKETPGLGGEIDNRKWQASWQGKQIVNPQGDVVLGLIKGKVVPNSPLAAYQVDGLAGASLTSRGVSNLIQFWVGEDGFGPFLRRIRNQQSGSVSTLSGTLSREG
jgi:Na+-transporting NADH:ubiquinone oxidoreductase subunit C